MSDINFCETKEQLNHLGEVVTGKTNGSPSGADIETSTLPYTGQVRKTLPALEEEYQAGIDNFVQVSDQVIVDKTAEFDTSIANKEAEADAAIDSYRLLNKGPYASGITLESKFEYITYNGESYFATNPPYTTTATTPDADGNLFAGGYLTSQQLSLYTDIVYKASGGNSAVENMIAEVPLAIDVGETCQCENGTIFKRIGNATVGIDDYKPLSPVNVKDFGAVGDGSADDTVAIQTALDAPSEVLYIPTGVYLVSSITVPEGVNVYGVGDSSVLRSEVLDDTFILQGDNVIRDLRFEKNALWDGIGSTGGCHIRSTNVSNITVMDCEFDKSPFQGFNNVGGDNISVKGCEFRNGDWESGRTDQSDIGINGSTNISIHDCRLLSGNDSGINLNGCTDILVYGNSSDSHVRHGIALYEIGAEGRVSIQGNNCNDNGWFGIYCNNQNQFPTSQASISISGNVVSGNGHTGDGIHDHFQGGICAFQVNNVSITGNTVRDCPVGAAFGSNGIVGRYMSRSIISSNVIDECEGHGIYITPNVDTVTVSDNIIRNVSLNGISAADASAVNQNTKLVITGNTVYNADFGIYAGYMVLSNVSGNSVVLCQSHGILVSDSEYVTIAGNSVGDASNSNPSAGNFDGIRVDRSIGVSATGNTTSNTTAGSGQRYGVFISECTTGSVEGNSYGENRVGGLAFSNSGGFSGVSVTSPPSSGDWIQGNIVWRRNAAAGSGQPVGWVCTVSGTPGTWNGFGEVML